MISCSALRIQTTSWWFRLVVWGMIHSSTEFRYDTNIIMQVS